MQHLFNQNEKYIYWAQNRHQNVEIISSTITAIICIMSKRPRLTQTCHEVISATILPGDCAIDATIGNGHDTLFLSNAVGATGHVIGFDIQPQAIASTEETLRKANAPSRVTLINESHSNLSNYIPEECNHKIRAAMFNLGYLPGSDKTVVTNSRETLSGVSQACQLIAPGGAVSIMAYPGHSGGKEESDAVIRFVEALDRDQFETSIQRSHAETGPILILIKKRS